MGAIPIFSVVPIMTENGNVAGTSLEKSIAPPPNRCHDAVHISNFCVDTTQPGACHRELVRGGSG